MYAIDLAKLFTVGKVGFEPRKLTPLNAIMLGFFAQNSVINSITDVFKLSEY